MNALRLMVENGAAAAVRLSNALVQTDRIEQMIFGGFICGASLLVVHAAFSSLARRVGGRTARVFVELQRKSFHMLGGCLICAMYHWGIKQGVLKPAFVEVGTTVPDVAAGTSEPMDAGLAFLSCCLVSWILEASRLTIPTVQTWYLRSFKGLIRDKERNKAAGIAYFFPGALAAMLAAPSNVAILGILFLSVGDAAASIGTAAGCIPVGASSRKVEGSIGCFVVCALLASYAGLAADVAVTASALVTLGEVLAEVIGVDDNVVIPMLGVLGVRMGLFPQLWKMLVMMGVGLGTGVLLGVVVGSTTSKEARQ